MVSLLLLSTLLSSCGTKKMKFNHATELPLRYVLSNTNTFRFVTAQGSTSDRLKSAL